MKVCINGQLFVKVKPDIFQVPLSDQFDFQIFRMTTGDFKGKDDITNLFNKLMNKTGSDDYSGMCDFWSYIYHNGKTTLVNTGYYDMLEPMTKSYDNEETMNEYFISLADFLKDAEYVGRHFRRTKQLGKYNILSYRSDDIEPLLLYRKDNIMLVLYEDSMYEMLSPVHSKDGNYEIYGEINDSYRDKQKIYMDILKQVTDSQRRR